MAGTRAKGQEVEVLIVVNGQVKDTITDVRSFEMEAQLEVLKEGYLGETTDRRDDIYRGVKGKISLHFENSDVLSLMRDLIDRARRRTPGVAVNIKASINFPGGQRTRVMLPNVFFGPIPMNFGGRADYGTIDLDFEGEDFKVISG
jgi:hypothetical protein